MSDLKLSLMIEAIDRFTTPAEKISRVTDKLANSLQSGQKELNKLAQVDANLSKFKSLEKQLGQTASQLDEAKRTTANFGRELAELKKQQDTKPSKQLENQIKKLTKQFDAAKNRVDHLSKKHRNLRSSTREASEALSRMGVSGRDAARGQDALNRALDASQRKMEKLATIEAKMQRSEQRRDQALQRAANLSLVAGSMETAGRKMLGAVRGPLDEAISFEEAMADVKKVVDFAEPDGLKKLSFRLIEMTRTIPLAKEELAQIASAGGQLGIKENDLPDYVETVAKMATAFDMMPDVAGESMAKLANVYQVPLDKIGPLGDAINHLSNNTAAKASDIVRVLSRIGGTAKQFDLATTEAAALADAFIALGRPPEVAGTAINALLTKLQTATVQSKSFKDGLGEIGYSAEEMATMVNNDGQGALNALFQSLQQLDKGERSNVIAQMFGAEYADDISLLVGGLDQYSKALGLVSKQTDYAGSMEKEFQARADTSANKIQLMEQRWDAIQLRMGERLIPLLDTFMDGLDWLMDTIDALSDRFPSATTAVLGTVAVIGGIAVVAAPAVAALAALTASMAYLGHAARKARLGSQLAGVNGGTKGGRGGRFGGKYRKLGGAVGAGLTALTIADIVTDDSASTADKVQGTTQAVGGIGGALAGAAAGAALGSVIPGAGTVIGGLLGLIGGGLGAWAGDGLGGDVGTMLASLVSGDTAKKPADTMLALQNQTSNPVMSAAPQGVNQTNHNTYQMSIQQQPGEDSEAFAQRLVQMLQEQQMQQQLSTGGAR